MRNLNYVQRDERELAHLMRLSGTADLLLLLFARIMLFIYIVLDNLHAGFAAQENPLGTQPAESLAVLASV